MAKIYIDRPNEIFNGRTPHQIYIDDKKVGTIGNGENKSFEVEQGEHTVVTKMNFFMGSPKVLVKVKGDEVQRLKVTGISGAIWLVGVAAVAFGIRYAMEPFFDIDQYTYIMFPCIFLMYFLTIGRKKYLTLILEE